MNLLMILLLLLPLLPVLLYLSVLYWAGQKPKPMTAPADDTRGLSVILTCYNEERGIVAKVNALLDQCAKLPLAGYELLVVSDGSDDGTNALLQQFHGHAHVRLLCLPKRMGKANALNVGVAAAQHPLLLLSDVRQALAEDALARLHARMQDPALGAVSACLVHRGRPSPLRAMLNWLKRMESRAGSTVGVYGPLYMIRRSCFRPIPVETILDDLLISLQVISQAKRVEVEPLAEMYDIELPRLYAKARALRLITGLRQLLRVHHREIFRMRRRFVLFLFVQKYFKLLLPFYAFLFLVVVGVGYFQDRVAWHLMWLLPLVAMVCVRELRLLLRLAWHYVGNLHRLTVLETVKWQKMR